MNLILLRFSFRMTNIKCFRKKSDLPQFVFEIYSVIDFTGPLKWWCDLSTDYLFTVRFSNGNEIYVTQIL